MYWSLAIVIGSYIQSRNVVIARILLVGSVNVGNNQSDILPVMSAGRIKSRFEERFNSTGRSY